MLNKIILHGYLGKEPELKEIQGRENTFSRVNFSLAVSRNFGDETDWFYCVMYGKRAEVIEKFFHKGSEITLEGRMESFRSDDKTFWNVVVTDFDFCGKGKKSSDDEHLEGFVEVENDEDFELF